MKNFKKIIIVGLVLIGIVFLLIFQRLKTKNDFEEFNEENLIIVEEEKETPKEKEYIIIHITGEVNNPGVVKIEKGSRVIDAVEKSGGLTNNADQNKINLAYILSDGQKIYIPSIYDEDENAFIEEGIGQNMAEEFSLNKLKEKININTATQTELETLTGIGPSTALKIINFRKENGNFKNIEELKNVPGIGEAKFNVIKDDICI